MGINITGGVGGSSSGDGSTSSVASPNLTFSSRIGEFFFAKQDESRSLELGFLAVNPGTITDGAVNYPLWAAQYPEYISGDDIVFPADVEGMFLRNLNGNAASEGDFQSDSTAVNGLSGTVLGAGLVGNNRRTGGSANAVRTGQTRNVAFTGDVETVPVNRAYQLYTIVDSHAESDSLLAVSAISDFAGELITLDTGATSIVYNDINPGTGVVSVFDGQITRFANRARLNFQVRFDEDDIFTLNIAGAILPTSRILTAKATALSGNGSHEPFSDINFSVSSGTLLFFNRANSIDADVIWNIEVVVDGYEEFRPLVDVDGFDDQSANGYYDIGSVRHMFGRYSGGDNGTQILPAMFANTDYVVTLTCDSGTSAAPADNNSRSACVELKTTAQFGIETNGTAIAFSWTAIGLKPE